MDERSAFTVAVQAGAAQIKPRAYQVELLEMAKTNNVIAFLDTGAGKTFIAVMLLQHRLTASLSTHQATARAVFLVPRVPLVFQQAEVLAAHLPCAVGRYVGEMGVDLWDSRRWGREWERHGVLVMTPQILLNLLTHAIIPISRVHTIVFDECHHTQKKHPYNLIMKEFYHRVTGSTPRPHILGLTAAPANVRREQASWRLSKNIVTLEGNLDAHVVTVLDREDVEAAAPPPTLRICYYSCGQGHPPELRALLRAISHARLRLAAAGDLVSQVWTHELEQKMGSAKKSSGRVYFDPVISGFSTSRFNQMLSGVQHVTETLGMWCGAQAARSIFKTLITEVAPTYMAGMGANKKGEGFEYQTFNPSAARLAAMSVHHMQPRRMGRDTVVMGETMADEEGSNSDMSDEEVPTFPRQEIEQEQTATNLSALEVVVAFAQALLPTGAPQAAKCEDMICMLRRRVEGGQLIKDLPVKTMEELLGAVTPYELQAEVDALGVVEEAAGPPASAVPGADLRVTAVLAGGAAHVVPMTQEPRRLGLVTQKVVVLVEQLLQYRGTATQNETDGSCWSGIVFVTRRLACWAVHMLLSTLPCTRAFLRTAAVTGYQQRTGEAVGVRHQEETLRGFRQGTLNLLVATAVVEEGIDVRRCQLVVRFDLPPTAQSYIQSRGRARMQNSVLILMVQTELPEELEMINHMIKFEADLRQEVLSNIHKMKEKGLVEDASESSESEEDDGINDEELRYMVASTGARVSAGNVLRLLHTYISKLPTDRYSILRPTYRTEALLDGMYLTHAFLPSNCPLRETVGMPQSTRRKSIASAALNAIRLLHESGSLNDNLLPAAFELAAERRHASGVQSGGGSDWPVAEVIPAVVIDPPKRHLIQGFHPPAPSGEHGEVLLHPYRWLVVDDRSRTLAASSSGPAKAMRDLVCLLLEPLPEGLPPCRLPGNDGASNQLAFLPGPAVRVSGDQLRQLKACHVALAQLMLARGPPRHAAGQRRKAEVAVAVAAEAADGEGGMVPEPDEIVAGATGGTAPAPPHADIGRAGVAHEAAPTPHDDRPEDKGAGLFVRALVRRIIDRVIILQDGHLPKSRRGKASRAAGVSPEALSFLLAPAAPSGDGSIDWRLVAEVCGDAGSTSVLALLRRGVDLRDRIIWTTYNRKVHAFRGVRHDLNLQSTFKTSEDRGSAPRGKRRAAGAAPAAVSAAGSPADEAPPTTTRTSYAAYYAERWGLPNLDPGQPLIEASAWKQGAGGRLDAAAEPEEGEASVALVPELCEASPIPAALWAPLLQLPRLMHRLEAGLAAARLLDQLVGPDTARTLRRPSLALLRTALTLRSAGEGSDYETLETLGDTFMKYAVCAELFFENRTYHEGQLTRCKDDVVSNLSLAQRAQALGLHSALQVLPFSVGNWTAPPIVKVGGKVLADGMEALVGAFVVGSGEEATRVFMRVLGLLKALQPSSKLEPAPGGDADVAHQEVDVDAIQRVLGYTFARPGLVCEALTHCSWSGRNGSCYQRLEFLGDALLDLVVVQHCFDSFTDVEPSDLHDMRSVAVNAERLAFVAVHHGLQRHIRHASPKLLSHLTDFVSMWRDEMTRETAAEERRRRQAQSVRPAGPRAVAHSTTAGASYCGDASVHETARIALMNRHAFGFPTMEAPKVLCDVVEALVGAVYVDSGGRLDVVCRVAFRLLHPMVNPRTTSIHPVRRLMETLQTFSGALPEYKLVAWVQERAHVQVSCMDVLLGESKGGRNARSSGRLAAQDALDRWRELEPKLREALVLRAAAKKDGLASMKTPKLVRA
uniref:Uncharacterized protein n=1 Tax=Auxenochlorella protothecoides TaxID=3075 RepID=A0A1D1ZXU0_AUXPR